MGAVMGALLTLPGCGQDTAPERCQEDAPCWAWSTMGNHKRGLTINGRHVVVGPCAFRRAMTTARDVHPFTSMGKGDDWALAHGCEHATPHHGG